MKKRIKYIFILLLSTSCLFSSPVFADNYGLKNTADAAGLSSVGGAESGGVTALIGNIIGTALSMIGVVFFVLMIYAGLRWMTARGNSEYTQKALDTIIAAVIGMVVVLASYALTKFVFDAVPATNPSSSTDVPAASAP